MWPQSDREQSTCVCKGPCLDVLCSPSPSGTTPSATGRGTGSGSTRPAPPATRSSTIWSPTPPTSLASAPTKMTVGAHGASRSFTTPTWVVRAVFFYFTLFFWSYYVWPTCCSSCQYTQKDDALWPPDQQSGVQSLSAPSARSKMKNILISTEWPEFWLLHTFFLYNFTDKKLRPPHPKPIVSVDFKSQTTTLHLFFTA